MSAFVRKLFVLLLVVSALLLAGCTGKYSPSVPLPTDDTGLPHPSEQWDALLGSQLFPVVMQPQADVPLPLRSVSMAIPVQSSESASRGVSYEAGDLLRLGDEYDDSLPLKNTSKDATYHLAEMSPDWDPGAGKLDFAMCTYRFPIAGFDPGENQTIGFTWAYEPAQWNDVFVGIVNHPSSRWQWYGNLSDRVLTVDSLADMLYPNGDLLVAVVTMGTADVSVMEIEIGVDELRGTGAEQTTIPGVVVPLAGGDQLPGSYDLTPDCAPMNDQEWWGACTAFGIGDGALNYEINKIYGPPGYDLGWDLNTPTNRISPKHLYIISGELQGKHPPNPGWNGTTLVPFYGRRMDLMSTDLITNGVASDWNAPYDMKYEKNWSTEADDDAALLTIDSWDHVLTFQDGMDGTENLKILLALHHRPIAIQQPLDSAFLSISPGTVWQFTGPIIGWHALLVVGYDDAKNAFKIRNSWGADWGEDGYCWIDYSNFDSSVEGVEGLTLNVSFDADVADRFCGQQPYALAPVFNASDGWFSDKVRVRWEETPYATVYEIYRDSMGTPVASFDTGTPEYPDDLTWWDEGIADNDSHTYWMRSQRESTWSPTGMDTGYLGEPGQGQWYMANGNHRNTRCVDAIGPAVFNERVGNLNANTDTSPVYDAASKAYFGESRRIQNYLITGEEVDNETYNSERNYVNSPALGADGSLYYTEGESGTYFLRSFTPGLEEDWAYPLAGGADPGAPTVDSAGTIYVASGALNAINPDGTEKWTLPGSYSNTPAVADDGKIYVLKSDTGTTYLTAIDPDSSVRWDWEVGWYPSARDPIISESGLIFLATGAGNIYGIRDLDPEEQDPPGTDPLSELQWTYPIGLTSVTMWSQALSNSDVFVFTYFKAGNTPTMVAINSAGEFLWDFTVDEPEVLYVFSPSIDGEGTVYCCWAGAADTGPTYLYAINSDGTVKWHYDEYPKYWIKDISINNDGSLWFSKNLRGFGLGSSI